MKPAISIIIPAFNEEGHLGITVAETIKTIEPEVSDYEIIIVNDGSFDGTRSLAEELSVKNPHIRVIHNEENKGLGFSCKRGIRQAAKDYIGWVPADTVWEPNILREVLRGLGQADIITTYLLMTHERPLLRRILSRSFTVLLNILFGLNMRYFNGGCFHKRELLQSLSLQSKGFTIWAEALVRLRVRGCSCIELGAYFSERKTGKSTALSMRSVKNTRDMLLTLIRDVYFLRQPCGGDVQKKILKLPI